MAIIEGKLTRLRPVQADDADRYVEWMNDPEVIRHLSARYPISHAWEEEWLASAAKRVSPPDISLAIETLDGRHIGSIGLHGIGPEDRHASLGIVIGAKDCWSQGYGSDALRALLRFGFDEINLNRVWLEVFADNARAIASYKKCGFVEEGRLRQHWFRRGAYRDSLIMGVLREEFWTLEGKASDA
jgi:RimJ/RimL family protein N-acetyltransferase